MREASHQFFVRKYLDWEKVNNRLQEYAYTAELFPPQQLQKCSEKHPYYCHYLAWRLGTWQKESWFTFFNQLLKPASRLPGWKNRRVPGGCEFDNFWGFLWELQSATLLSGKPGLSIEWLEKGPDLKVVSGSDVFYVECTTYRKSFGLEEFVEELFRQIDPEIMVTHVPFLKFSLPKNKGIAEFLDELFSLYQDPSFLPTMKEKLQEESPILLPVPLGTENFYVYLENPNAAVQNFELASILHGTGDPEKFLKKALHEAINNKALANQLSNLRPNLVMINFLLGLDWQLGSALRNLEPPELPKSIDGLFLTACGIDTLPREENATRILRDDCQVVKQVLSG